MQPHHIWHSTKLHDLKHVIVLESKTLYTTSSAQYMFVCCPINNYITPHHIKINISAKAQFEILRHSTKPTLIGPPPPVTMLRNHYTRELKQVRDAQHDYQYDSYYPKSY